MPGERGGRRRGWKMCVKCGDRAGIGARSNIQIGRELKVVREHEKGGERGSGEGWTDMCK